MPKMRLMLGALILPMPLGVLGGELVKRLRLMRLRLGTVVLGVVAGSAPMAHATHGNQACASSL